MNGRRKFILFELNEVPLRVFRHHAERHPRSAVAKVLARGRRWDTLSEDEGHLSPWITWPTLHRGVSNREHGISALGQDVSEADAQYPPVWKLLARAGRRVGMFGSLHTYPLPDDLSSYAFYMPDTFAAGPEAYPPELSVFQSFNLGMVDKSGRNVSRELPLRQAMRFLGGALKLGLRPNTMAKIARQIAAERMKPDRSVRRRTIQSLLSFDLFFHQLARTRPDAVFYFTNHVASSMHRYWPATFRGDYRHIEWKDDWIARFADEIDYAMGEADAMIAELVGFVDGNPDYVLLIGGSMGQAAVDDPVPPVLTQLMLRDAARFVAALGITGGWHRRRTMEPLYTFVFDEESDADAFVAAIGRLLVAGNRITTVRLDGHGVEVHLGHPNVPDGDFTALLGNREIAPADLGIGNVRIQDEVGSAAYHVPQGCLLVYDPREDGQGRAAPGTVPTTQIAPTLLAMLDVPRPAHMQPPIAGLASSGGAPAEAARVPVA